MLKAVKKINTGYHTNYTDISGEIREVKHSIVYNTEQKQEIEKQVVEELYRIFTHYRKGCSYGYSSLCEKVNRA